ncbi:MAG TPA: flagellar hook capping FlgD N-terminal domain-containing protein [Phycisphaerales bacterium]|nr:flagellar hook capping FlgD N-terminal domain-containing protein [Phycisphaerales bacterium]
MPVPPVTSGSSTPGVNKFAELSSESFVRIMTAELTSQDPLKPNDSSKILEQMSSLRQIESSTTLTNKLEQLVSQSQFSAASSLLGATVSGISENGTRQAGVALSIVRTSKGPALVLDTGYRIPVSNIDTVDLTIFEEEPPPPTPTPTPAPKPAGTPLHEPGLVGWVTANTPVPAPAGGNK